MASSPASGRALVVLAFLILALAVAFDLARPAPFLFSVWRSLSRGEAPVERTLNEAVRTVVPRR